MHAATEVTECYLTTGSADFVLVLTVDDVEAFQEFVKTKLNTVSNVRKFKSMIALHRVKVEPRATLSLSPNCTDVTAHAEGTRTMTKSPLMRKMAVSPCRRDKA
ncbi:Lrp/AsnC ligand binding domain-containing protein [Mesorhizobium sp. M0340]